MSDNFFLDGPRKEPKDKTLDALRDLLVCEVLPYDREDRPHHTMGQELDRIVAKEESYGTIDMIEAVMEGSPRDMVSTINSLANFLCVAVERLREARKLLLQGK